jgi:conjugative transfer signal peptidase TraF
MLRKPSRRAKYIVGMGSAVVAALLVAQQAGIRINTTKSYPPGLYLLTDAPIENGSLVIFCPPDTAVIREARARGYVGAGFCAGGYGYMIKKILAQGQDKVTIDADGVAVNGELIPNTAPMLVDTEGQALLVHPMHHVTLHDDQVLLMSDYSPKSFDGRYFGPVDKASVISAVRPLWLW